MTPAELKQYLGCLVGQNICLSTMIWGPPGIGKSSIVRQVAHQQDLAFVDVRLSQLAPTDLRGLPVPDHDVTRWYPPDFLPREGRGILFLDEINMAPPAMQGVAQQLILDRRVGSYSVPDGWFIWAAGNRKEDRASVYDMPTPLANRFIHLDVETCIENFRLYAFRQNFHESIVGFIAFRRELLHKPVPGEQAWPSPRSWEMANQLFESGLNIEPAVGVGAAAEFYAYVDLVGSVPDLDGIANGVSTPEFPEETSLKYATVMGLVGRADTVERAICAMRWLAKSAPAEWTQLFAADLFPQLRDRGLMEDTHQKIMDDEQLRDFLIQYASLMAG